MTSLPTNEKQSSPKNHKVDRYRCLCGEVLVETCAELNITPGRVEGMKCPQCGARYVRAAKETET